MTPKSSDLISLLNWKATVWIIGGLQLNVSGPQNKNLQNWTNVWPDLLLWLTSISHHSPDAHPWGLDCFLSLLSQLLFYQLPACVTSPRLNLVGTVHLLYSHFEPLSLHNCSHSGLAVSPCFSSSYYTLLAAKSSQTTPLMMFFSAQTTKWLPVFIHRTCGAQIIFPAAEPPLPILTTQPTFQLNLITHSSNLPWTFVRVVPFARKSFPPPLPLLLKSDLSEPGLLIL